MAERRMISKSFINNAKFMKMSDSAKLLYFYLNVNADDDGIVEVFPFHRMLSIKEDDVRNLAEKEFIVFLDTEMLSFLPHWLQNNQLRSDRHKTSVHRNMLLNRYPKYLRNLKEVKREVYEKSIQSEELSSETVKSLGWSTNCIPEVDDCETQSSIGQSSLEKNRVVKQSLDQVSLIEESREEFEVSQEPMHRVDTIKDRLFNMKTTDKEDVLIVASDVFAEISKKDSNHLLRSIEKYHNDLVIEALAITKTNNAKTLSYTFKILQDFDNKGIVNRKKFIESEADRGIKSKFIKSERLPAWIEPELEKTEREKRVYKKYLAEKAADDSLTLKKLYDDQLLDLIEIVILKKCLVKRKE